MAKRTRNRNLPRNSAKNTKKSAESASSGKEEANPGYKAFKSRSQRPERSKASKSHGAVSAPRSPSKASAAPPKRPKHLIWGHHAAKAALENPKRVLNRVYATDSMASRLNLSGTNLSIVSPQELDGLVPNGASHQGIAVDCQALPGLHLDDIAHPAKGCLLVLDQITDPHNVGAMFRLAAAFGVGGIIMQDRHAPPLSGACAKVAVGTLETVPAVLVTNIANSLLALQKAGWRVTGLAGEAEIDLQTAVHNPTAEVIVMGAEGPGLRKRVRDCCDQLANIPMPGMKAESLNVSTAAGIALYEVIRGG